MGLGCGNPQAIASLRAGETVLDLGSGGGFDCFLAGRAVGPTGKVIGVDMTAERGIPANLFYLSPTEGVIHLEALSMIEFAHLRSCTKLAELTDGARFELQERIKWHFTRTEEPRDR